MRLVMAIMAGLQIMIGSVAFAEVIPQPWAGLAVAILGGGQAAVAGYLGKHPEDIAESVRLKRPAERDVEPRSE